MKSVVVCGGSKGLGLATVKNLLAKEFKVICISRSKGSISEDIFANENFSLILCDLSNAEQRATLALDLANIENIWGIVNNASGPATGPVESASRAEYLKALDTHLFASDELVKAILPQLKRNGGGRIVSIISVTARIPLENMSVSNTLRGAMLNWTKTLSKEVARFNITVNNVLPGYTDTERLLEVIDGVSAKQGISKDDYSNKIISQIPMGRFGRPEEIGAVAGFLISEEASFVNGVSIPVDGGWTPCP
ncbi:SDR family oxidoreductase [Candidatus Dojkabacteria bacterium]|jgi:3-oxoacyl-[acyl-carrier protein] reductase|uniref:SDR family oxidoreductase n=1 Tax=Candidatus Dojkabacteria bacterium TaxID=2099670 RepID=A0A5C7J9I1_9BACT|nr:MAG: SDR family oxidoreductase [Candidatus Dojkabacteria bacterium]